MSTSTTRRHHALFRGGLSGIFPAYRRIDLVEARSDGRMRLIDSCCNLKADEEVLAVRWLRLQSGVYLRVVVCAAKR